MAAAPRAARRPRITSPVSGSVYALDPDIPFDRQRLAVNVSGAVAGYRLILDKKPLGDANVVISAVGRDLYEKFFQGYTRKQWGMDPSGLGKSVTARVPTRYN